jgi:hypothetical protein
LLIQLPYNNNHDSPPATLKLYLFFSYRRILPLFFSDTDPYFSLPKYKVLIPGYTEVDASVIGFYFTDDDYADFYNDYNPEYDNNPYFYLDTTKGKTKILISFFI